MARTTTIRRVALLMMFLFVGFAVGVLLFGMLLPDQARPWYRRAGEGSMPDEPGVGSGSKGQIGENIGDADEPKSSGPKRPPKDIVRVDHPLAQSKECTKLLDSLNAQGKLAKSALYMVMNVTGDFHSYLNWVFNMSLANKLAWARLHGDMDVVFFPYKWDTERPAFWMKIPAALQLLPYYDQVIFLDVDGLVTNMDVTIEDLMERKPNPRDHADYQPKTSDLIIAKTFEFFGLDKNDALDEQEAKTESYRLNSGSFILKNTPWSYDFFTRVYGQTKYTDFSNHEQRSMQVLLREGDDKYHVKFLEEHELNIHNWRHKEGDFFIHYFGGMQCQNIGAKDCKEDWTKRYKDSLEQAKKRKFQQEQAGIPPPPRGFVF